MTAPLQPREEAFPAAAGGRSFRWGRLLTLAGAIAGGVGVCGFLVGIAQPVTPQRARVHGTDIPTAAAMPVPSYRQLTDPARNPSHPVPAQFAGLVQPRWDLFAPVVRTPEMKDAALRDRLRTRAFDGAPPVIPHAVEQQSATSCLVCHAQGMMVGDRLATRISHPPFANCTQCHVESTGGHPLTGHEPAGERVPANTFAGLQRSGPGERAMPHAPPTIPHTLQLRGECLSCHGVRARPGLRTTHPWLQNCTQCHVAGSDLESPSALAVPVAVREK